MRRTIMPSITDEQFAHLVANSRSYADITRGVGLRVQGSNYSTIKNRIARQNLTTIHFDPRAAAKNKATIPLDRILIKGSHYGSNDLKKRLVKEGKLIYRCCACGNEGQWRGKPLTLQLDHENGDHTDNRLENLRILCPNCHTQTGTHSGKRQKGRGKKHTCPECQRPCARQSKVCQICAKKRRVSRFVWPDHDTLQGMLWKQRAIDIAIHIGCSYTRLRIHCLKSGIQLPGSGYWLRRRYGQTHEEALAGPPEPSYRHMTDAQIERAKILAAQGNSYRKIGQELGLHYTTISRRLNGVDRSRKMVPQP